MTSQDIAYGVLTLAVITIAPLVVFIASEWSEVRDYVERFRRPRARHKR